MRPNHPRILGTTDTKPLMNILFAFIVCATTSSALAAPDIEISAKLSGSPATAAKKVTFVTDVTPGADAKAEFVMPRVKTKSGEKTVIEVIREYRFPTEGGSSPTAFTTKNVGATIPLIATMKDGLISFSGFCQVVSAGALDQKQGEVVANAFTIQEVHFSGLAHPDQPISMHFDERKDADSLTFTFRIIKSNLEKP